MTMEDIWQHAAVWWISIGIALLILEMLTGTLFFLFVSAATFLTALLAWSLGLSEWLQALVFSLGMVAAVTAWRRYRPNPDDKVEQRAGAEGLNNRLAAYVGREAILEEAIINGQGRIRLDDSFWNVLGDDLPVGSRVRIVAIEGMTLKVQPL